MVNSFIHWQDQRRLRLQQDCPSSLHTWLTDTGSLTARLLQLSHQNFRVEVLHQGFAPIRLDERRLLGLKGPSAVLVREVILYGCGQPWVFARSLLPLSSLTGRLRQLRKTSRKPLGAFLFKHTRMFRSPLKIAKFSPQSGVIPQIYQQSQNLYGRSSVFYVDAKPLLVCEVFLPDFLKTIGGK